MSEIKNLCEKWDVKLYDRAINPEEPPSPWYDEGSTCSYGLAPRITLGRYQDPELRLISFFHELGHICDIKNELIPKYEDLPYYHFAEASAWKTAFLLAEKVGITFSEKAVNWAKEELATYFEDDNLERTPLRFLETALEYGFGI